MSAQKKAATDNEIPKFAFQHSGGPKPVTAFLQEPGAFLLLALIEGE
jgi:hypothetical protein